MAFNGGFESATATTDQIVNLIKGDTDRLDRVWSKQEYFNYLFFILRKRLVAKNCGNIGYLWDRIPADSRIPDHSIWNHASMVSALGSAFMESETKTASLVVFSISPVQSFIGKTRKLRDHWAASIILSWLCFEGIAAVIEHLGPDHVVYPSLQDQPLVEEYLKNPFADLFQESELKGHPKKDPAVASLPNKFVFIAPSGKEEAVVTGIENRIGQKWQEIAEAVLGFISEKGGHAEEIFNRQTRSWWRFNWSSANLVTLDHRKDMELLFPDKFDTLFETIDKFSQSYRVANIAYPATHTLIQTALAASKTRPTSVREPEPGIKCPVCGELEVVHDYSGKTDRAAYKIATDTFWKKLSKRFGAATVREKEKLCAVCSIKRFAPGVLQDMPHPLKTVFKDFEFPSTTEISTWEYCEKLKAHGLLNDPDIKRKLINELHEDTLEKSEDVKSLLKKARKNNLHHSEADNYYAILMMDGDKMGDLVNGTAIPARWRDVLHPALVSLYEKGVLKEKWPLWKEYFEKPRILSPGLHAALSESLGAFSLYAVPKIIQSCHGKLIYAGGDDVAAVLPLSMAIGAAEKIQQAYNTRFAMITEDGVAEAGVLEDGSRPVFLFPGNGNGVSISAAVLICHHKQPLRGALEEAHRLLENVAKNQTGRNAFAIRLKKRSGQARDFARQWDEANLFFDDGSCSVLNSFRKVQQAYSKGHLSGSLLYRIPDLETMIYAILPKTNCLSEGEKEKLIHVIAYEIDHSGGLQMEHSDEKHKKQKKIIARELASHIAGISIRWDENSGKKGAWEFNGEVSVIARYLARGGDQQ